MFLCSFALGNCGGNFVTCALFFYFHNFRNTGGVGGDIYGGPVHGDNCWQYHPANGHGGGADGDQGTEQLHLDHFWKFAHPRFLLHRSFGNLAGLPKSKLTPVISYIFGSL